MDIVGQHVFISALRRLCLHRYLFVRLFVCLQDHAKTTQPILTRFCGKMAPEPRKN